MVPTEDVLEIENAHFAPQFIAFIMFPSANKNVNRTVVMKFIGSCSACGRQVSAIPMSEVMQLMMSGGEDAIKAKATRCPKCAKLFCTGCVHGAGRKCPTCRVDVEEVH